MVSLQDLEDVRVRQLNQLEIDWPIVWAKDKSICYSQLLLFSNRFSAENNSNFKCVVLVNLSECRVIIFADAFRIYL